jgi:hypothetical protein
LLTHVFLFLLDQTIGICSISNLEWHWTLRSCAYN